ncbi:MAG: hypothetical protein FJY81_06065 [Candidatus Aminicenantes bacterium]|nr:hypothetical protein [Candidatus Aminicenantes bacterium]
MRKLLLWLLAVLLTVSSAVYQRMTGPTYPLRGRAIVANEEIRFRLPRSYEITSDCPVVVKTADARISGRLEYKRYKTSDAWTDVPMTREDDRLVGHLPRQPMAGKLAYRVFLADGAEEVSLTGEEQVIIRFKGVVPGSVLIGHVIFMFLAMLFSTRAGLAALDRKSHPRKLVLWTVGLLFIGGFIFGPLVQKYAFDAWWTGFPFGFDLTDNKTLIAMAGWVAALVAGRGDRPARGWVLAAGVLMLVIFLIPHSLLGSELKYPD